MCIQLIPSAATLAIAALTRRPSIRIIQTQSGWADPNGLYKSTDGGEHCEFLLGGTASFFIGQHRLDPLILISYMLAAAILGPAYFFKIG